MKPLIHCWFFFGSVLAYKIEKFDICEVSQLSLPVFFVFFVQLLTVQCSDWKFKGCGVHTKNRWENFLYNPSSPDIAIGSCCLPKSYESRDFELVRGIRYISNLCCVVCTKTRQQCWLARNFRIFIQVAQRVDSVTRCASFYADL